MPWIPVCRGVRQLQDWIVSAPTPAQLIEPAPPGGCCTGKDPEFLALKTSPEAPLLLNGPPRLWP